MSQQFECYYFEEPELLKAIEVRLEAEEIPQRCIEANALFRDPYFGEPPRCPPGLKEFWNAAFPLDSYYDGVRDYEHGALYGEYPRFHAIYSPSNVRGVVEKIDRQEELKLSGVEQIADWMSLFHGAQEKGMGIAIRIR